MRDVSRLLTGYIPFASTRKTSVTLRRGGGGGGGVKHNVKITLFSAKIVRTSPLNRCAILAKSTLFS